MQRINDTWASISQNVEAASQWRKWLYIPNANAQRLAVLVLYVWIADSV